MKLKLSALERIQLGELIPQQGNRLMLRIAQGIQEKVDLTAKEIQDWKIETTPLPSGGITFKFDSEKGKDKEIEFLDPEIELFKQHVEKMDKAEQILLKHLPLIDKILGGK